jgi:hypothetical protein
MELNGRTAAKLTRFGPSAPGTRARRTYDRITTDM